MGHRIGWLNGENDPFKTDSKQASYGLSSASPKQSLQTFQGRSKMTRFHSILDELGASGYQDVTIVFAQEKPRNE
jgi:hypothetical protein